VLRYGIALQQDTDVFFCLGQSRFVRKPASRAHACAVAHARECCDARGSPLSRVPSEAGLGVSAFRAFDCTALRAKRECRRVAVQEWHACRSNMWSQSIRSRCLNGLSIATCGGRMLIFPRIGSVEQSVCTCAWVALRHVVLKHVMIIRAAAPRIAGALRRPAHPALRVPASAWCILCSRGRVVAMLELATRLREIVAFCSQCAFDMLQLDPERSLPPAFDYAPCGVKMCATRPAMRMCIESLPIAAPQRHSS
jgi:hypothetical protein